MLNDTQLVAEKLRRWDEYVGKYRLPAWDSIPDLGLYMEQVIVLLRQYLEYLPPEIKEEQVVTAAAVNNYVRMKIMPEPRKKRYYRLHLAYLILISTLKRGMSIQMISRLIPVGMTEEDMQRMYSEYAERYHVVSEYFVQQVRQAAAPLLGGTDTSGITTDKPEELIAMSAMLGGLARLLAEKLLLLEDVKDVKTEEKADADGPQVSDPPEDAETIG